MSNPHLRLLACWSVVVLAAPLTSCASGTSFIACTLLTLSKCTDAVDKRPSFVSCLLLTLSKCTDAVQRGVAQHNSYQFGFYELRSVLAYMQMYFRHWKRSYPARVSPGFVRLW